MTSRTFPIEGIRLDGGRPCLDFVNTIHGRLAGRTVDYLSTPHRYAEWCVRARLLNRYEADRIGAAPGFMADMRTFREHLHALLCARIDGIATPANALRACDHWLHEAWADLSLDPGCREGVSWSPAALDARMPLKRIALSALGVLCAAETCRLKRCASSSCGRLFYDDSKGGRRRWCSMEACGTVEKMRRYRRMRASP